MPARDTVRGPVRGPVRIANCSGFYGDRLSAASEMVNDGPIDVLTGDWLAELTMLILARTRAKQPGGGYAKSFVTQMEQVMGTCLDRGIKVVSKLFYTMRLGKAVEPELVQQMIADRSRVSAICQRTVCAERRATLVGASVYMRSLRTSR